jgi:hypothetical protein
MMGPMRKIMSEEATIEFEVQGKQQRQMFYVLTETGDDRVVLGMPWLAEENPLIDWKNRKVQVREKVQKSLSNGLGD